MASLRELRSLVGTALVVCGPPVMLTALAAGHLSLNGGVQALTGLLGL